MSSFTRLFKTRYPRSLQSRFSLDTALLYSFHLSVYNQMPPDIQSQIDLFLLSGEHDPLFSSFDGVDLIDRCKSGHRTLVNALKCKVATCERQIRIPIPKGIPFDLRKFTRSKVEPMVRGLFRKVEQEKVLLLMDGCLVVLLPNTIQATIDSADLGTAWKLANLYLLSIDAEPISSEAPLIVGMSVGTRCYVSMSYFDQSQPFDDYVVHEAAHLFHNAKREPIGLPKLRRSEWLLPIAFSKRELFAYSCAVYSRILLISKDKRERLLEFEKAKDSFRPDDERVDPDQLFFILGEAVQARFGWKTILTHCASC